MELRKEKEIEYYDSQAQVWLTEKSGRGWQGDFEGFNPLTLSSFQYLYKLLEENSNGKKLLDYGCGNGVHATFPAKHGAQVVAIDLSEKSLEIAKERARREGVADKISFLKMDCEKLEFPDNSFDVILDGGTFSSIDLNKAYPELRRVLKSEGLLIGIETFGHNPITNLKRKLNKKTGKRTNWATSHILQEKDLQEAKKYFNKIQYRTFHLFTWVFIPLLKIPGVSIFMRLCEFLDRVLLKTSFLKNYGFKIVFVFSEPKKI